MVDRNIRNKRINDQAPNVNTRKRYNNNVLAATKTGPNKQMRPTEAITQKVDTPKPIEKTTEVNGQTAKEADTQKSKKIHGRDTPKTQPNSIKHSESTNRYNCQQKVGKHRTKQQRKNKSTQHHKRHKQTSQAHKRNKQRPITPQKQKDPHTSQYKTQHQERKPTTIAEKKSNTTTSTDL